MASYKTEKFTVEKLSIDQRKITQIGKILFQRICMDAKTTCYLGRMDQYFNYLILITFLFRPVSSLGPDNQKCR